MINNKELEIANTSYTNKDFGAIYTEILGIAQKISAFWSPQTSNESDPGVVLLKLLAFLGDKLNYNTDKNILEAFMPSATQNTSMRKLCDMMGYYVNYYKSATTNITVTYNGSKLSLEDDEEEKKYVQFSRFKTVFSNDDSSLQYVLWEPISLNSLNRTGTAIVKQGYLNTLNVGNSDKITLDNLDSQNRIYFGETQIAQNGILVKAYGQDDETATFWKDVENLNVQNPGAPCFKFSFDSKRGLPYIEFPNDVASLIGDGLSIRYLVTSGYYGNAGVGSLTKIVSPTTLDVTQLSTVVDTLSLTDEAESNNILIRNNSAAVNGSNPEDIDSAYNNFKKTIGTFETLVTCRDYANYIYNSIVGVGGNPLVSNVQVADRRLDVNSSKNILTYDNTGKHNVNESTDYTSLFIYPLRGINNPSNESEYEDSFNLLTDITPIKEELEYEESPSIISYKYVRGTSDSEGVLNMDDIALIKLLYNLDVKITTTYKVNTAEQADIKMTIIQALRRTFYSRNIDYGYEIPYESIYNCILNSDSRIKSISLKEPELDTSYLSINNIILPKNGLSTAYPAYSDSPYLKVLAKNVLAGRVPLFEYDTRFNYEFGMGTYVDDNSNIVGPIINNVERFTSIADITLSNPEESGGSEYEVGKNELIQLIGPKLVDEMEYSTYVNYYYQGNTIHADQDTLLGTDDKLLIVYNDTAQNQIEILYKAGDIIRSTFEINASDFTNDAITKRYKTIKTPSIISALGTGSSIPLLGIPTKDSIVKRNIVQHEFDSTIKVAWLVSDKVEDNVIYPKFNVVPRESGDPYVYEFILGDNDYFIYSKDGESSYEVFGSGTSLRIQSDADITVSNYFNGYCPIPNLNDLYEYGISSLSKVLKDVTFNSGVRLTIQVNNIMTLAEGDKAYVDGDDIRLNDNTWKPFGQRVLHYTLVDETTPQTLPGYNLGDDIYKNWRIRSRLDLICGKNKTQILEENQSVTFYKTISEILTSYEIKGSLGGRFRSNINFEKAGGTDVSLSIVDPNSLLSDVEYPLSILVFKDSLNKVENFPRTNGYYRAQIDTASLSDFTSGYDVLIPNDLDNPKTLVMLYVDFLDSLTAGSVTLEAIGTGESGEDLTIKNYGNGDTVSTINYDTESKLFILQLPSNITKLKITPTLPSGVNTLGTLYLGEIKPTDGYNKRFNLKGMAEELSSSLTTVSVSTLEEALKSIITSIDTNNIFYYNADLDNSEQIEEEDLSTAYVFFDSNNIASRIAIAYIDITNSNFEITRSSKL